MVANPLAAFPQQRDPQSMVRALWHKMAHLLTQTALGLCSGAHGLCVRKGLQQLLMLCGRKRRRNGEIRSKYC